MDLIEIRLLAVGGILAVGIVVSTLTVTAIAVADWIARVYRARAARSTEASPVSGRPGLGAGNARC